MVIRSQDERLHPNRFYEFIQLSNLIPTHNVGDFRTPVGEDHRNGGQEHNEAEFIHFCQKKSSDIEKIDESETNARAVLKRR